MQELLAIAQGVEGCALVALCVGLWLLRASAREESGRSKRALAHVENRLTELLKAVEKNANEALSRTHEVEVEVAGIKPALEALGQRVDELAVAVSRCATREDLVSMQSDLEEALGRILREGSHRNN